MKFHQNLRFPHPNPSSPKMRIAKRALALALPFWCFVTALPLSLAHDAACSP